MTISITYICPFTLSDIHNMYLYVCTCVFFSYSIVSCLYFIDNVDIAAFSDMSEESLVSFFQ